MQKVLELYEDVLSRTIDWLERRRIIRLGPSGAGQMVLYGALMTIAAVFTVLLIVVIAAFVWALVALPVWQIWNLVVPDLFDLPELNYAKALGLTALVGLLFGRGS